MLIAEMPELGQITGEQAWLPSHMTAVPCAANARLAVVDDCYGMSCSRRRSLRAITIQS
jgi:hypothetical protein